MPDSYGRPLWTSPRFRWDSSHAAPNVRNVNDPAAKANPMMYQIPVKPSSLRAGHPGWTPGTRSVVGLRGIRDQPSGDGRRPRPFYRSGLAVASLAEGVTDGPAANP